MDKRMALPAGWELHFPGLRCTVEHEIGRGSNAIVYRGWYADASDSRQHHPVLIKELFPYHERGTVYRDFRDESIHFEPEDIPIMDMHRESFRWGNEIHLKMKALYPDETGTNINTYAYNGTYYTLLDFSGGRTLDAEVSSPKERPTARRIVQRCIGVLDALKAFHDMGFLHLDISPDNVILLNQGRRERVELIDYNSVVRMRGKELDDPIRLSMKQGYAAPEVRKGDLLGIGPWTDLYSVTVLFYFCLMEQPLSRMQISGIAPVRVHTSKYLQDAPATVKAQIQKILVKGLAASGKRRYQTVMEMLKDFQELLDRIDGTGITHWSLWEACGSSVRQEVGGNTGLAYLTGEDSLYPLEMSDADGVNVPSLLHRNRNAVLTGSGGMGKTTLFLRTAWLESQCYREDRPVVCYLSLRDYCPGDGKFIHDKLLRKMRFSADMVTYENARHTLDLLLQKPLATKQGMRPVVYLLLDGYNEISGDPQALCSEIRQLANMEGVNLLIASRNELPEYAFESWSVEQLKEETVTHILGKNGLLMPEEPQVCSLLRNPMMLSLFVKASLSQGTQLKVADSEDLIRTYLGSVVDKAVQSLPEEAAQIWQVKAAVDCVLPLIAGLSQKQALTNDLLVGEVSKVYGLLYSGLIKKRYPGWSGHIGDICAGAEQAEGWYRLMVQEILWRQLGLLVRDSEGQFRIFHQTFQDALAPQGQELLAAIGKRRGFQGVVLAGIVLAVVGCLFCLLAPRQVPHYDPQKAIDMMGYVQMLAVEMENEHTIMLGLLDNPTPEQDGFDQNTYKAVPGFSKARRQLENPNLIFLMDRVPDGKSEGDGNLLEEYQGKVAGLSETGQRLPWNKLPVDEESMKNAVSWFHEIQGRYLGYLDVLERVYTQAPEDYEHCCRLIRQVVEADIKVCAAHYLITCDLRLAGLADWENTPDGRLYAGTAKRLGDGVILHPAISEAVRQLENALEDGENIVSDAEAVSEQRRSELAKDKVYIRYVYFQ